MNPIESGPGDITEGVDMPKTQVLMGNHELKSSFANRKLEVTWDIAKLSCL